MDPQLNLIIVHSRKLAALSDWTTVRYAIHSRAPDIEVRIVDDTSSGTVTRRWQASRPSLVFSASLLGAYKPAGGTVLISRPIPEKIQYKRLMEAGVATPRTIELLPGMVLRPMLWGEYVIVKPQGKGRYGSDLRLVRTDEVGPRYLALINNPDANRALVKQYIHSVDDAGYPIEFRVLTMFGKVLFAFRNRVLDKQPPLADLSRDLHGIRSSDAFARERTLAYDEDVLQLARAAAAALPQSACLGIDILRDAATGKVYVIEANAGGYIWSFSSERSRTYDRNFRRSLYTQFNALDLVADLLIEKTRAEAS